MKSLGTEEFSIINSWLGWGNPDNGLWFIGVEEAKSWECGSPDDIHISRMKIASLRNQKYSVYLDKTQRDSVTWPVAAVTAKIAASLNGDIAEWDAYREDKLWLPGNSIFSGNILALGKPSLKISDWPIGYKELFGFSAQDYSAYYAEAIAARKLAFQQLRAEKSPQAIICFGITAWTIFEDVFVNDKSSFHENEVRNTRIFENDRVILTRHFSNGMSDSLVLFIAEKLRRWGVNID